MSKNKTSYGHIKRLIFLAAFLILSLVVLRMVFIPKTFWEFGFYRGDSIAENANKPIIFAGSSACKDCHEEKYKIWLDFRHKTVICETCHGPAIKHSENPMEIKPTKPGKREFCLYCHGKNISKPKSFPVVDGNIHNPGINCFECHNPHNPKQRQK